MDATYQQAHSDALNARENWLEKTELPRLKEEFRTFHAAFASLYNIFLKKGLIHEDPYKQEAKIGEIEVPETGSFSDAERMDQISIRLSNYDNQLDFLVNFYQFSVDFLTLDKIKRILGLVKYIDWIRFTTDSESYNTKAVVELVAQSKNGLDPLSLSVVSESTANLYKCTGSILTILKELSDFHRETYKAGLRTAVTAGMSAAEASFAQIKKKFSAVMPGKPFYPDLVEELIKEDYSKDGPALREKILKQLAVPEAKQKIAKPAVSFKSILIEGIQAVASVSSTLEEIAPRLDDNELLLENRQRSFWERVKRIMQQMMNKEPEAVIYDIEYMDSSKGTLVREKVNFSSFRADMAKKTKNLAVLGARAAAAAKSETLDETQLLQLLERSIRDVQSLHRTLAALDEFFKAEVDKADRDKVKGIKPELATIKNAIIKANRKRHDYSAQKEEEEQLKRLGVRV
ncbi:MAG: hypothetical protein LBQ14_05445 [Treponema sp.]|jgi:hypothetical protein|nr:hypothetical protein [Treponema sp.]